MTQVAEDRVSSEPESKIPVAPGQIIGDRYRIGAIIGEGGMGVVCAATHVGLGTPVAVKLTQSPDSSARFENPQHDFPQRIEYRRTGHALHAEIAGPRQGKERVIAFDYELCAREPKRP